MKKTITLSIGRRHNIRALGTAAMSIALSLLLSGCFLQAAIRDYDSGAGTPWWCQGSPDLSENDCVVFSIYLDVAVAFADDYPTLADYTAAGATAAPGFTAVGLGKPYILGATSAFDPGQPNVLFFEDNLPQSRVISVGWAVDDAGGVPTGFTGDRENWLLDAGKYWQPLWVLRGFANHPDVFATAHPCMAGPGGSNILTSTTDACYLASHTQPFEVMVTNDDGIEAEGIDHLVEALYGLSNVTVNVVAPAENQSGSGDAQTGAGFDVTGSATTTLSGRTATEVFSTDPVRPSGSGSPADAVVYGLNVMQLSPDLVLSGTNEGQNIANLSSISGTVGAARTALRNGFDAIASSTGGIVITSDFTAGVAATMALVEQWRLGTAGAPFMALPSINIPTCVVGLSVRGTVNTVVAPAANGRPLAGQAAQDCSSTETIINDDVDAFNHGFVGIADVGKNSPPNWP